MQQLESILKNAEQHYRLASSLEISLEANPEDITDAYLKDLANIGINRLSLGIQSFKSEKLHWLSRTHTAEKSQAAVECAKRHFQNVSIDLIFGVENESLTDWESELRTALSFELPHLSTYSLTIEPRTLLSKLIKQGKRQPPLDSLQADMFLLTMHVLRQYGYVHYEVSNFAQPHFQSQHNSSYWNRVPYLGFGPAAHSFVKTERGEVRFANVASLNTYLASPTDALLFQETLTEKDIFNETVLLGLRQEKGINLSELAKKFRNLQAQLLKQYEEKVSTFVASGLLLQERSPAGDIIKLTDKGFTLADEIAESLFL
ncbi:MAG: radical SAM family heme chaperone HemW [Chloroherpetonaceae bacterium]|nr:radical SAM family heme chaperone HemW [Chloroherpetonaceae bacterium]